MGNDKPYNSPPESECVDAFSLHQHVAEKRRQQERQRQEKERRREDEAYHAYFEFLNRQFTEADRLRIRDLTRAAVHAGKFEVEILRFPARYLDDKGRAINNGDKDWPKSLKGFAASGYDAYVDIAKPLGYWLTARVLDYPNGNIGDIGIYLNW